MPERGSDILAYTTSYGDRPYLAKLVPDLRATSGLWFDWLVCLGAPSKELVKVAYKHLLDPEHLGIQHLKVWEENRGQHHTTREALALAREKGYKWLLRLDDDIKGRTARWLKKMVERLEDIKARKGDEYYRFIAAPRIVGLKNPLQPIGSLNVGQDYPVEVMGILGGACRLHPVELLEKYEPNVYDPVGRGDPEQIEKYASQAGGMLLRFPDIRVVHHTEQLEGQDTPEQAHLRKMSKYWCWLGEGV